MGKPGSQRTMQQLVDDHYQALYRYAYRLSGSGPEADDLTQDAFCKAQTNLAQLRDKQRAKAWLFSILRNTYLHHLRDRKRETILNLDTVGEVAEALPDPLPEIEPERLQQVLNDMPETFRTPIVLYYFEDFSYRAIAEQMDLPMGTVMSRLSRAKALLRSQLVEGTNHHRGTENTES